MTTETQQRLLALCGTAFRPSGPISKMDLFAGRLDQLRKVSNAVRTQARHAILFGDRGVGKTSLASIFNDIFIGDDGMRIVKVNCADTDDFRNVWRKALKKIPMIQEAPVRDAENNMPVERRLSDLMEEGEAFGPGEVRELLETASQDQYELVIIFDEFDVLAPEVRSLFATTIKDLSDNLISTTIVLVAVATNVVDLIHEHASIDRCLAEILVPPMDRKELGEIIAKGMKLLGMTMDRDAADWIIALSQGYPHYTHLLAQESTFKAIYAERMNVTLGDVNEGIKEALDNTLLTVRDNYRLATQGQRKGTLFPQVLLACALAETDELGYLSSADVRKPLSQITGKAYDIPNYAQHLDGFCDPSRGPVLQKRGTARRFKFRFLNPLLRPFILMKGLKEGRISPELVLTVLGGNKEGSPPENDMGPLFAKTKEPPN